MSIKETDENQFEKFKDDLASTYISGGYPIENIKENMIHQLRNKQTWRG